MVDIYYDCFAPCPPGLETVLAQELNRLKLKAVKAARAGVSFQADMQAIMRVNLHSRIALRVLIEVVSSSYETEQDIFELALETPWEVWFGYQQTIRVDITAHKSPLTSLKLCALKVKDAICDRLRSQEGDRPSVDTVAPDVRIYVHLEGQQVLLYLDTSGESLFKRGWRLDKGEAPLRENLAAGLLALSGWMGADQSEQASPGGTLYDPFCGSGTIAIEAALYALGVPAGINRQFGFGNLRIYAADTWNQLVEEALSNILPSLPYPIYASDIDASAIEAAQQNALRAGLAEDVIQWEISDVRKAQLPADIKPGWIVTNPPYGERLALEDAQSLYAEWASHLKQNFGGWQLYLITSDMQVPKLLRLNPERRTPIYNGALDCRLFKFQIVSGSFRNKN